MGVVGIYKTAKDYVLFNASGKFFYKSIMDIEPEQCVDEFAIHRLLGEGGQAKYSTSNLAST
jgi:hypothetical protein